MWLGHSCPRPLTVILIFDFDLVLVLDSDFHAQTNSRPKIRIPSHAAALPECRPGSLRHLLQRKSNPALFTSPRCHPPALPARQRQTLRSPRSSSNARSCAPFVFAIERRKGLALLSAHNPEAAQRHISPKRQPTRKLQRPSLAGRILRPRPPLTRELRRKAGIPPPKSGAPRTGEQTGRL
jgi:hypothetical protein